ncbi:hypothetical protein CQW23_02920, partial [Capsicum baccatum]
CGISGLFDFSASPEIVRSEIVRCIDLAEDGIHAVLLVLSVRSCFTRQQQAAVQSLLVFFGGKISDYMIEALAMCKSRLVLFDNRTRDPIKKADQLKELLEQVNLVVEKNGGIPYTNDLFKKLKEGAASFPDSKSKFGSSAGHSEQEIKELIKDEMQRSHEEQKSKLKVNLQLLVKLDKQLGKERAARLAAESKVRKAQKKSKDEARKLKDLLEMSMVYDSAVLIVLLSCIIYWLYQEKIKGHPYVKEVNEPPSGTSNTITDTINEEAPHEPSLMDFGEQTPTTEQNPPVVESGRDSTQKINVSGGTYHEQVLMKVDMNAIESLVKTYVSCTVLSSEAFQELINNIIVGMSISIVAMAVNSDDLSQNANLPDPSLQMANVEVPNELRVYDSMLSSQHREPSHEIKRLSEMLPTYISYSGLLENTERTVWSSLESYKDKMSNVAGDFNDTPFDVEYVEDIAQQVSRSLDCGVFMAAYAEFLSDQMQISSSNLDAEYLRNRYASLLWNYGFKKAKKIYSSDHDDPP